MLRGHLARVVQRRRDHRREPEGGERLRQSLEQRHFGADQQNPRHGVLHSACDVSGDVVDRASGDSLDFNNFGTRGLAGENLNGVTWNREDGGKKFHELVVRCAVDWWCRQPNLQCIAVQSRDFRSRRTRLHTHRKANAAGGFTNLESTQWGMTPWSRFNRNHATSGVMSIMPMRGTMRCSGAIIHSVSTYDHRIHFE